MATTVSLRSTIYGLGKPRLLWDKRYHVLQTEDTDDEYCLLVLGDYCDAKIPTTGGGGGGTPSCSSGGGLSTSPAEMSVSAV